MLTKNNDVSEWLYFIIIAFNLLICAVSFIDFISFFFLLRMDLGGIGYDFLSLCFLSTAEINGKRLTVFL